jgi:Protein of unknown function (DUF2971)
MMGTNKAELPPPILYKYRTCENLGWIEDIIVRSNLWWSSPRDFNDPYDCRPVIDVSGSQSEAKQLVKRVVNRSLKGEPRNVRRARFKEANCNVGKALGQRITNAGGRDAWEDSIARMGLLSLTARSDSMLMWSHYAASHRGICLGFDTSKTPFGLAHAVCYDDNRPVFRPLDPDRSRLMERVLLRKAECWNYEEEWRVFGPGRVGNVNFAEAALSTVILGSNITSTDRAKIEEMISRRRFDLRVVKAHLNEQRYDLDLKPA